MELVIYIFCIMVAFVFSGRPALQTEKSVLELFPDYVSLKQDYQDLKQDYQDFKQDNQDIKAELAAIKSRQNERGTTYIRWSRKRCPNNGYTELVYSGYAGGGEWDQSGSAPESVCLPSDPDFVKTSNAGVVGGGYMFGTKFDYNFAPNSNNRNLPCAVCRVKQASTVIMIPGKNRCYTGWNMEYHGYLASNYYNAAAAGSYVCIDIQPEYLNGGVKNSMKLLPNVDHYFVLRTKRIIHLLVLFVQNKC